VSENNSELQQITYIKQTVPVIAQALQKSKQGKNIQWWIFDCDMSRQSRSNKCF